MLCTRVPVPFQSPPSLTSQRSRLAGLFRLHNTWAPGPGKLRQPRRPPDIFYTHTHASSSDLALIAQVLKENRRCEKIKCVSLTFTKGQLGLVPDFWNHFPAESSDVGREQRDQGRLGFLSRRARARVCSKRADGCVTWHHRDKSSLSSLHFQSVRFQHCVFRGFSLPSRSCHECQPLGDLGSSLCIIKPRHTLSLSGYNVDKDGGAMQTWRFKQKNNGPSK